MKISYPTGDNSWTEKEQDWTQEECEKHGGHCWKEYQPQFSFNSFLPPRERTCTHCGLKQTLNIEHKESWV